MTLPLTPDLLEATYDFLRRTPPFNRWNLPTGGEITFRVTRNTKTQGDHLLHDGRHTIRVSSRKVGYTTGLVALMAHEMVHVVCDREGIRSEHGALFRRRAASICRIHGFDPMEF